MVNNAKKIVRKNEEMKKKFDKDYKKKIRGDIFSIVMSYLLVVIYALVFVLLFIFNRKPDGSESYKFAAFSVIITFAFEIVEWCRILLKNNDDCFLCKIIHRPEFSVVLAIVLFSVFCMLYNSFFIKGLYWLEEKNISIDAMTSIAVFVYLLLNCSRNVYLQLKKANKQEKEKFSQGTGES